MVARRERAAGVCLVLAAKLLGAALFSEIIKVQSVRRVLKFPVEISAWVSQVAFLCAQITPCMNLFCLLPAARLTAHVLTRPGCVLARPGPSRNWLHSYDSLFFLMCSTPDVMEPVSCDHGLH